MNNAATFEDIQSFMSKSLAKILKARPEDIDTTIAFDRYGVDSASAIELTGMLSAWLHRELEPTLLFDHSTIDKLSRFLAEEGASSTAEVAERPIAFAGRRAEHG